MVRRAGYVIVFAALMGAAAMAQQAQQVQPTSAIYTPTTVVESQLYCGGVVGGKHVKAENYVISGADSNNKITFSQFDDVFINEGADKGVKVGDQFAITREESDYDPTAWFEWQKSLMNAMGTYVADIGRVRVVSVQPKTAVAQVVLSCDFIQRGDTVEPFVQRPAPTLKSEANFDKYAAPSGKAKAMVVFAQHFSSLTAAGRTVYVNLGASQGVKVGDYFRIFRYQDNHHETSYQPGGMAYAVYGLGSTPRPYKWDELPRDVLGEGIVLRTGPNSATVFITNSQREIFAGDYVELE